MRRVLLVVALVLSGHLNIVVACLWDSDTLAVERARMPLVHELIVGYFPRHSRSFYEWRVEQLSDKQDLSAAEFDDLAVAYDKLRQPKKAIETIRRKLDSWPETGRYESLANLGTMLIHAGQYREGLVHIQGAIEINPDAHFGREVYQQRLVEYLLSKRGEGDAFTLPLDPGTTSFRPSGFAAFLLGSELPQSDEAQERFKHEASLAIKGVSGMLRFGHHDSPVLLEAIGSLLLVQGYPNDSKRLAARAFLLASRADVTPRASSAYRAIAIDILSTQANRNRGHEQLELAALEATLDKELAAVQDLNRQIEESEASWIEANGDVEALFQDHYLVGEPPRLKIADVGSRSGYLSGATRFALAIGLPILMCGLAVAWFRRRRNTRLSH